MNKTSRSVITDFQLMLRFESVRKQLLEPPYAECLDRAVAYYAVASDRHLPLALIQRTVRELINTPLEQLQSVPGIGPKKLEILINLLGRTVRACSGRRLPVEASLLMAPSAGQSCFGGAIL